MCQRRILVLATSRNLLRTIEPTSYSRGHWFNRLSLTHKDLAERPPKQAATLNSKHRTCMWHGAERDGHASTFVWTNLTQGDPLPREVHVAVLERGRLTGSRDTLEYLAVCELSEFRATRQRHWVRSTNETPGVFRLLRLRSIVSSET